MRTLIIASNRTHASKLKDMYPGFKIVVPGDALYGERYAFVDDRRDPTVKQTAAVWERDQEWLDCEVRIRVKDGVIKAFDA